MSTVAENLERVLQRIATASNNRDNVKLIAVSKTKPVEDMIEAYNAGQRIFGENKVQEARDKKPLLPAPADLHLIGPLQKNKAKYCPKIFSTIHTLHRLDVAEKLNQKSREIDVVIDVLVQLNLSGETTKSGLTDLDEMKRLNDQIVGMANLRLVGLMTIGNPAATQVETRKVYSDLRKTLITESKRLGLECQMQELSMGMSSDYELALEEGATYVRVGSAIFGART